MGFFGMIWSVFCLFLFLGFSIFAFFISNEYWAYSELRDDYETRWSWYGGCEIKVIDSKGVKEWAPCSGVGNKWFIENYGVRKKN